jgi:4-amino-4-deoxy-L-arabinose transferase-like glycosyltransferase
LHEGTTVGPSFRSGARPARAAWPAPWLIIVLALFCVPLFVNLGQEDLENDEAIYSFAIDRMLSTGDWLVPRTSPHDDVPFLQKPPLKFWMVAAPIRAGLLPPNEFGLRFWDALLGSAAFVYVFLLGSRLINPIGGAVAVLLLFAHAPLLFTHGLRSNNMEAPLVLAYCGGVYHYLAWARHRTPDLKVGPASNRAAVGPSFSSGALHVFAVALYFVLAFLTKFVAALFLPVALGAACLLLADHRRRFRRDWRIWAAAAALAVALIAPWFVFAYNRFGAEVWRTMLGQHVYQRFTGVLDPGHLHPWYYYVTPMVDYWESGALALILAGFVWLAVRAVRRRWADGLVIVLWFTLPMIVISAGTTKIYHYAYPFLPALALAGGYLAALLLALGPAPFGRALDRLYARGSTSMPRAVAPARRPSIRAALVLGIAVSIALALWSLVFGVARVTIGGIELESAGVLRPGIAAFVCAVLLGIPPTARRAALALLVVSLLPLQGYRDSLALLGVGAHPKRSASDCLRGVGVGTPQLARGLYVDVPDGAISHSTFYYFERVRPWIRGQSARPDPLPYYLTDSAGQRPVLISRAIYEEYRRQTPTTVPAMRALSEDVLLLLPGPYAVCRDDPRQHG